jgi:hypothetical protein
MLRTCRRGYFCVDSNVNSCFRAWTALRMLELVWLWLIPGPREWRHRSGVSKTAAAKSSFAPGLDLGHR